MRNILRGWPQEKLMDLMSRFHTFHPLHQEAERQYVKNGLEYLKAGEGWVDGNAP